MKILITGASGFFGKQLVSSLEKENQIFKLNRKKSDYNVDLSKEKPFFNKKFDLVIHNAGKAHFKPKTYDEKKLFYDVNEKGTINLLSGFKKKSKPSFFVYISSVSVYGLTKGHLINETSPLLAKDPYGKSKIKAEIIVQDWCKKHNVICTILRLPLIVGPNPPGNLGSMIKAIKKGYYFNVGGGVAKKSMVLASDVCKFLIDASSVGGIYNLTDGNHPNFNNLSKLISNQIGRSRPLNMPIFVARFLGLIGDFFGEKFPINSEKLKKITSTLTFDDSKARSLFGWSPETVMKGFRISKDK